MKTIENFGRPLNPYYQTRTFFHRDIIIEDEGILISDNAEVAEILNNYFIDAVEGLNIEPFAVPADNISTDNIEKTDIEKIIKKYEGHPSILKIKENIVLDKKVCF